MHHILRHLLILSAISVACAAHADIYNYSYSGTGLAGSGQVSMTAAAGTGGMFIVTGITGQVNAANIVTLLPTGTFNNNDNLFYFTPTYLDGNGVSFTLDSGANVNINYSNGDWFLLGDQNFVLGGGTIQSSALRPGFLFNSAATGNTTVQLDSFTFSPATAETPEPSSFMLVGTGLLGAAGMARRRFLRA